jgi:hypothetical protein
MNKRPRETAVPKRSRADQKHDLLVAAQSGLPLIGQALEQATQLQWEEDINRLVNQLLSSKPDPT